jgi:hypothetical protein
MLTSYPSGNVVNPAKSQVSKQPPHLCDHLGIDLFHLRQFQSLDAPSPHTVHAGQQPDRTLYLVVPGPVAVARHGPTVS